LDFSNYHNDTSQYSNNFESKFKDNIIILKRVKSIRQLKNIEKEWVRLCYKEAILKGGTYVKDIQCYIASKTKIWIERSGIEYLKKSEEEDDRKWYLNLAKDHFAYVSVHRKAIDELDQCKKELWSMFMNANSTNMEKIQIIKELHNLTKTHVLLLRDLPFVTNLSKYYNLDLINSNSPQQSSFQKPIEDEKYEKEIIERKVAEHLRKMVDESALFTSEQKRKMGITASTNEDDKKTDPVMESMNKQLNATPHDILENINNEEYQESIRKLKEIRED
jgi:hypothetical protein